MVSTSPELSVILPVFNEEMSIVPLLQELQTVLEDRFGDRFEVVVVDDGSTDDSATFVQRTAEIFPQIRLISLDANQGQSLALWAGFEAAHGEWIATLDADGQNDPADIPLLYEVTDQADAVFGYRARRKDSLSKRIGGKLANGVRNLLLGEDIKDTGCSLKLFRRSLTTTLVPWDGMHRFFGTLFLMQQARIVQMPVNHRPRKAGVSKYTNTGRLKKTWGHLMAIRKGPEGFLKE